MKESFIAKILTFLIASLLGSTLGYTQGTLIGGPCEGCEAVFEYEKNSLSSVDTLPDFETEGEQLKISGIVYKPDGITPAENVILYVYQTNEEGIYPKKGNETGWARRHGYIRGWVKTDAEGQYTFYTQKPHFYGNEPAHIHLTILEPDGSYYYINDFRFEGDKNLTSRHTNNPAPRGGSNGIMNLSKESGLLVGQRDIILRKNIFKE